MPRVSSNARAKLLNIVSTKQLAGIMFGYALGGTAPSGKVKTKPLEFNLCKNKSELVGFMICSSPPVFLNITEKDFNAMGDEPFLDFDYSSDEFILNN